jgi:hypothetical protein
MPSTTISEVFDTITTATLENRRNELTTQAFTIVPILNWLKGKGRVQEESGGRQIRVELLYGKNATLKWIGRGGVVSISDSNVATVAYADWRKVAESIVRFGEDDRVNRGKFQAINYVNGKIDSAIQTINEELESVLFVGDNTSEKPYGLETLVSATPTTGTVMGINRATAGNEYWRNQQASVGAYATYMLSKMSAMKLACLKYLGAIWSDYALITDATCYGYYETLALAKMQIYDTKIADLGFGGIKYDGVPVLWSPSCTAGYMYFLNSNGIKLYIDPENWLKLTEWKLIPDQVDDRVAQIKCVLQLALTRACNMGVLTGITAS